MVIGVTGGLATGKSTVMALFQAQGAIVFSADEAARAVLKPGGSVLQAIVEAFGPEMRLPDGTLDRPRLGKAVFGNEPARLQLNALTHPPILRLLRAQIRAAQEDWLQKPVVVEVPLLFETKMEGWFELIVVVSASESTQVARLRTRNGLNETEARKRLAAQWPLAEKTARADCVLQNDDSPETLRRDFLALWKRIKGPNGTNNPKKNL